jgi:hypothetical protein
LLTYQVAGATQILFQPYVNFRAGQGVSVGIGDFNSDQLNDVAMTTIGQLLIFQQGNEGELKNPMTLDAGTMPYTLAVGDLNNDETDDVVVVDYGSNTIGLFLQKADGLLASRMTMPTGIEPGAIAVGDLNNDGLDDIVISHFISEYIGVFTQTGTGTLNPMVTYPSPQVGGYDDIEIADINNDGRNDVIKMNGAGYPNPHLLVYLQNSNGTLDTALSYCSECDGKPSGMGAGDVTGDGLTDIVLSYGSNSSNSKIVVFAQTGDGNLQAPVSYASYEIPEPVEVADINADGLADVVTAHGKQQLGVFLQQNGTLNPYSLYEIPSIYRIFPQGMDIGDINNDGLTDVVIADLNNGLVVLYHTPEDVPPTITVTATNANNTPYIADTWINQTVTVKFTCSDTGSGIASCPADQVFSADGITPLTTGTATDNAGNSASISFGPIKIDKTRPTLSIAVSPNPVLLNGNAELLKTTADNLSGLRSGPCLNIDTSTVGLKSVTCIVGDNAGNWTTATANYQVIYDFDGFQKPVIDCTNNSCDIYNFSTFNTGSSIALKFQLTDANGNSIRAAADPLWLVPTRFDGISPFSLPNDYQFQVSNTPYEWKKNQEAYMYEWNTKGLPDQTVWVVGVRLDDGSTHYVFIKLKK